MTTRRYTFYNIYWDLGGARKKKKKNQFPMSNFGGLRQVLKGGSEKHLLKQREHHDKEFGIFWCNFRTDKTLRQTTLTINRLRDLKQHETLKWLKKDCKIHIKQTILIETYEF